MTGLSGGGWTTTVYAAIDPTIRCSVRWPDDSLYLRAGSVGDREQFEPAFYRLAGYPDLYVLGGTARRKQVQILVPATTVASARRNTTRNRPTAYAEAMREYEGRVKAAQEIVALVLLEIDKQRRAT